MTGAALRCPIGACTSVTRATWNIIVVRTVRYPISANRVSFGRVGAFIVFAAQYIKTQYKKNGNEFHRAVLSFIYGTVSVYYSVQWTEHAILVNFFAYRRCEMNVKLI